jgi:hypothetical protein
MLICANSSRLDCKSLCVCLYALTRQDLTARASIWYVLSTGDVWLCSCMCVHVHNVCVYVYIFIHTHMQNCIFSYAMAHEHAQAASEHSGKLYASEHLCAKRLPATWWALDCGMNQMSLLFGKRLFLGRILHSCNFWVQNKLTCQLNVRHWLSGTVIQWLWSLHTSFSMGLAPWSEWHSGMLSHSVPLSQQLSGTVYMTCW